MQIFDESGVTVAKYAYDAWGNCTVLYNVDGLAKLNPFRYRSYYYDQETGLYYLQSRYYDPETGRFLSSDAIEILDTAKDHVGGLNLYAYCFNDPVNDRDDNGEWSWKKFWKTVGVVALAVVTVAVVAAVTVASGGTLAPVLIGAAVGAATGLGTSVVTQAAFNGWDFGAVDWGQAFVDMSIGMVLGSFGGAGLGKVGMSIAQASTGFIGSIASDIVEGSGIDVGAAIRSGVMGGVFGRFTNGAQYGRMTGRQAILASRSRIISNAASYSKRWFAGAMNLNNWRLGNATVKLNRVAIGALISLGGILKQLGGRLGGVAFKY